VRSAHRGSDCFGPLAMSWMEPRTTLAIAPVRASLGRDDSEHHTGSATEYFTWLSAKLDSIEAMPSSRVSLVFRKAS
jgi:hypothetical protein